MYEAKIIADSVNPAGHRITTLQLRYWRAIHAEVMTHRAFSRNASSSRAIPVAKLLEQVRRDPAGPLHWGKNQPGMQAREELPSEIGTTARANWVRASMDAANRAEVLMELGVHKQVANRLLEPFQYISVIVTATEWDNFFALRDHEDAQPEIQHLARLMKQAMAESTPQPLAAGEWHVPYNTDHDRTQLSVMGQVKCSVARCARVSYLTHDGQAPSLTSDLRLHDQLVGSEPLHASPAEHQAMALPDSTPSRNFIGWHQYRAVLESGGGVAS